MGTWHIKIIEGKRTDFTCIGNQLDTAAGGQIFDLAYDKNGRMTTGPFAETTYNWEGKPLKSQYTITG